MKHILYECGICSCYHRWTFNGDCRQDNERFATPEDYAKQVGLSRAEYENLEVRSMSDRIEADERGEQ